jgi:hypothetical protein
MEGPGFVLDGDEGATSPPHRHGAPTADEEGLERARFPHHRPDVDRQVERRSAVGGHAAAHPVPHPTVTLPRGRQTDALGREPARHLNSLSVGSASDRLPQTPTPGLTVIAATRTCAERRSATTSAKVTRAPFAATTTGTHRPCPAEGSRTGTPVAGGPRTSSHAPASSGGMGGRPARLAPDEATRDRGRGAPRSDGQRLRPAAPSMYPTSGGARDGDN